MDVFSASFSDSKIAVYLNDGSNNYSEQVISTNAEDAAVSVFGADADGDGDVDVFSASFFDDKIAVYLNDGSNNYTEQVISSYAVVAFSVFAADADGDGDVDVFSASLYDDKIALYETVALPEVSIAAKAPPQKQARHREPLPSPSETAAGSITVFFDIMARPSITPLTIS